MPCAARPSRAGVEPPAAGSAGASPRGEPSRSGRRRSTRRRGRLLRLGDLELDGPWLDLHRAPTENDHGQG